MEDSAPTYCQCGKNLHHVSLGDCMRHIDAVLLTPDNIRTDGAACVYATLIGIAAHCRKHSLTDYTGALYAWAILALSVISYPVNYPNAVTPVARYQHSPERRAVFPATGFTS